MHEMPRRMWYDELSSFSNTHDWRSLRAIVSTSLSDPRSSDFHHLISDSFDTHPRWTTGKSKAVWCLADPLCSRAFRYVLQKAELLEQNQNCGCLHLPVARLNVSTVGVIPGIRKLTEDRYRFTVSIFCRNVAKCAEIWGCHMLPQLVTALVTFADTCFLLHHKNMAKIC